MPSGCNVCNSRIQKLSFFLSLIFFPTWIVVNDINFGSAKVFQWVPWRHKVLTHGQERLFRKVTSVSIHSFVERLDTFSYVLRPADVTVKEVNHIWCFAIDIAKYLILLSCRLAMEHLCVLQLETALASKTCPNGCDVIWSIRQWTSIWESKNWMPIWVLDVD
jgi:hypothetical protein